MDCCGLSSTGLQNIDANEITSDNTTIFSNLNVSGLTTLSNNTNIYGTLNVNGLTRLSNNTSVYGTLNVSGLTRLANNTSIYGSLNVSGLTVLSNDTNITNGSLYISGVNVLQTLNIHGTGLSTLYNFRSDNPDALITQQASTFSTLIHGVYPESEIKFETLLSKSNYEIEGNKCLTKIDTSGKLNVYHKYDELLQSKEEGYLVVHDELVDIFKQAQLNVLKFIAHDVEIDRIGLIASGAAAGVAAIILALGISSIVEGIVNHVDVVDMNNKINENTINLNSLSSVTTLAINELQNRTNFSNLIISGVTVHSSLNVSGFTTLSNNTTFLSSLNVSGLTTLNNDTTLLSSLNISGLTTLSNNTTIFGTLNVSGFTRLSNNTTLISSLNVSGFTTLSNNATVVSSINISGLSTLANMTTLLSSLNVSGFTTLNNDTTLLSSLNISGFTTLSNNATVVSSINISGLSTLGNITTCVSSLNVSGLTTLSNHITAYGTLNVSGYSTLVNDTTIVSSLNVSGLTTLSNNTTVYGTLNVSGLTTLSNNTTVLSSLSVSGRTIIGSDIYNYSDSVVEMYKNLNIRKTPIVGGTYDNIELKVGLGTRSSYLSMSEGYDINLYSHTGNIDLRCEDIDTAIRLMVPNGDIDLDAPQVNVSNNLTVAGKLKCLNLGQRIPMYFTTSRTVTLNGTNYSCYDIDLRLYTNSILLDGYNIRQFRIRTWLSDTDYQHPNMYQTNYSVFMSDRNGLSLFAQGGPFENYYFDLANPGLNQTLYRNNFDTLMYISRQGQKKVYCIIEDLL